MSKTNQIDMTTGPILSKLLMFSLPLIFSSILQLLFNAADVVVVGRFAGDSSLAAVGSTGSLINLLVNLFTGLSIGSNVVAAKYFGAGNKKALKDTVHTSILISIYSGLILTIIGVTLTKPILYAMQSPAEVLDLAAIYLRIYFAGIITSTIYNFGSALLRAKGDTKRPLYILLLSGVLNFVLNLFFVISLKQGVAGVALATIISQLLSAILVLLILCKEKDDFHLDLRKLKINTYILRDIVKIGVPAGFQGIIFSFSNVIIQSSVNLFGPVMIAGNSAVCNLEGFIYTSMNGFSQGSLTFCSQNFGAKKYDRIKKVVWLTQLSIFVISTIECFFGIMFGKPLIGIFSKNEDVIEAGFIRLKIIFGTYFLCGMMDALANSIRGIGHSLLPAMVTLIGACGIRLLLIATVFQIPRFHVPQTIFYLYPISWTLTLIALNVCYFKLKKRTLSCEKS